MKFRSEQVFVCDYIVASKGSVRTASLPGSKGLAEVTRQQISRPISFMQFQVADDQPDAEPFFRGQTRPSAAADSTLPDKLMPR
jgi:hypothetical protein